MLIAKRSPCLRISTFCWPTAASAAMRWRILPSTESASRRWAGRGCLAAEVTTPSSRAGQYGHAEHGKPERRLSPTPASDYRRSSPTTAPTITDPSVRLPPIITDHSADYHRPQRRLPPTITDHSADYRRLSPTTAPTTADYHRPQRRLPPTAAPTAALSLWLYLGTVTRISERPSPLSEEPQIGLGVW